MSSPFDPNNVDLDTADPAQVVCYLNASPNDYNGHLGARISALFVILAVSTFTTIFCVAAVRLRGFKLPLYVYLFARYFGAGVIVATAFIHLLDPAYSEIGPQTCVGMTKGWDSYSWPPAIALLSVMIIFLLDFAAERYVEVKYGIAHTDVDVEHRVVEQRQEGPADGESKPHQHSDLGAQGETFPSAQVQSDKKIETEIEIESLKERIDNHLFREQIAAFLILEFGVIVHSVIIGLNLGVVGDEFATLYPVIVFHQAFEGLGIGARMSAIPFPKKYRWLPWTLCVAYGLTTPIAIAIGLGVRTTYSGGSFTANIVSGILDSMSAGILIYTGLVELLARDFLFNPRRTKNNNQLTFMIISLIAGAGIMALLGKWA
ncbi:Zinc/iron permease [Lipomyces tetrasporus]|uniref:Zinc/iron permease n=1 Tax=Lipomyces tetrasporus TaxID=54092 RepID=A0AAD7QVW4_9ASCO|nr:Zinc/iron permease [Lipomyces tetrasporus]KAJ8100847.1 Zinc/iron permease [Lipomyces tetrasporus]